MAKVTSNMLLSGSLGDYSIYKMEGVEKFIIRAKGGPTKEQIANDPEFKPLRNSQAELSSGSKGAALIRYVTLALSPLADHAFSGKLTKVCRIIQAQDKIAERGKRAILFSKYGKMLEGMNFNDRKVMDNVLTQLPSFNIFREEHKATVSFPALLPKLNILNPWNHPEYRFIITFGVLQDMVYTENGYEITNPAVTLNRTRIITDWHSSNTPLAAKTFELTLEDNTILDASSSLLLAVGIQFGKVITTSLIEPIKKAGCAKIIGVR